MDDAIPSRTTLRPDPSSYRDWDGRVFVDDQHVLRALSLQGVENWEALATTDLFSRRIADGTLIGTWVASEAELAALRAADGERRWAGALVHERIRFVTYPYEWTFSMLQDAALLQLALVSDALDEALISKDASPYNIQWRGARPVFIDVGSFEQLRDGEVWAGYRQFCMLFLYPLLLEAHRGVRFQPWLRGSPNGIEPAEFRALFTRRDALRRGMMRHVFLHAKLEQANAHRGGEVGEELRAAGMDARLVKANVAQLTRIVGGLRSAAAAGAWQGYREVCSYDVGEVAQKDAFVREAIGRTNRDLVWDLGCNDGRYSRIAAEVSNLTLAIDADASVVDELYRSLREVGSASILPLTVDLTSPSPAVGWRNAERLTLLERGRPDVILCLALLHHLSITHNVPLREIVDWLRGFDCEAIVEFPHRSDPMVETLLSPKREGAHPDYDVGAFERLLREKYELLRTLELASGTRTLYLIRPA